MESAAASSQATEQDGCDRQASSADLEQAKFNWKEHFTTLSRSGGNFKVDCNYCHGQPISGGSTRFMDHLLGRKGVRACLNCPQELRSSLDLLCQQKEARSLAKRSRTEVLQTMERAARSQSLKQLSQSLQSGSVTVNKKWLQWQLLGC